MIQKALETVSKEEQRTIVQVTFVYSFMIIYEFIFFVHNNSTNFTAIESDFWVTHRNGKNIGHARRITKCLYRSWRVRWKNL